MKTVFVNPERCIGCKQCEIACAVEHSKSKDLYTAISERPAPRPRIHVTPGLYISTSFPSKCRHCDPPPCEVACPVGAISRDQDLGIVAIDSRKCIACAMCAMVCPFDVLTFYPSPDIQTDRPVALKCDHCVDRQRRGGIPACVEACKVGALEFGEINELVKTARTRLSERVSVAVGEIRPELACLPSHIDMWRDLGKTLGQVGNQN